MLNLGDTIVYPNQGVGIIAAIEEREFKGENLKFFHIKIINSTMKLITPINRVEDAHIRLVSEVKLIDDSLDKIGYYIETTENLQKSNRKEREVINNEKIKNGSFKDYLSVVCNLTQVKNCGNINANENQTLKNVKSFLEQEICQAKGISINDARAIIDEYLDLSFKI